MGHDPGLHLDFVDEAVGEQRAHGAVHHAHGQDFLLARRSLALSEATGVLAAGADLLAVVALHGEEVQSGTRVGPHAGGEDDGITIGDHHGSRSELCNPSGFESEHSAADFTFYNCRFHVYSCLRPGKLRFGTFRR